MHPADDINYCFKGISMLIFVALQFRCAPTSLYLKETPNRISDARTHCSFLFSLRATTLSTVELVRSETFFPPMWIHVGLMATLSIRSGCLFFSPPPPPSLMA